MAGVISRHSRGRIARVLSTALLLALASSSAAWAQARVLTGRVTSACTARRLAVIAATT